MKTPARYKQNRGCKEFLLSRIVNVGGETIRAAMFLHKDFSVV